MYKKHRVMLTLVMLFLGAISYLFSVDYAVIASDGITVVSIILAIYMTSFSSLVSSELAKKMQRKEDSELAGKSQLGVLRSYLNAAVCIGIINIIISCISMVLASKMELVVNKGVVYYIVSVCGCATLAGNICLMFLLFRFMVNRQLWNK